MPARPVGVWLDSYARPFRESLAAAAADGFTLVLGSALSGVLSPGELSLTGRKHLARTVRDAGLRIDGLALEFAGRGLAEPDQAERRFELLRQTVRLARDLGATRVVARVGGFEGQTPNDATRQPDDLTRQVLAEAADLSDRSGVVIAVLAAGGRTPEAARHIRSVGCNTLTLALDTLDAPDFAGVAAAVAGIVGCVFVRDVRQRGSAVEPVPFGAGDVDFAALLAALEQTAYVGPLVLRCEPAAASTLRRGRERLSGAAP